MALHMRTAHGIRLSLSVQAPFLLRASSTFCELLLALGGHYPRSGGRNAQGVVSLLAPTSIYWALIRMVRSGKWDAQIVITGIVDLEPVSAQTAIYGGAHARSGQSS